MDWDHALQEAIYTRLSGYAALTALADVVDNVTPDQAYPYVTIGESIVSENNTDDTEGVNIDINIHIWSTQNGFSETKQIAEQVTDALARYDLTITGYTLITCEFVSSTNILDADGKTRHGVVTFTIQFE